MTAMRAGFTLTRNRDECVWLRARVEWTQSGPRAGATPTGTIAMWRVTELMNQQKRRSIDSQHPGRRDRN